MQELIQKALIKAAVDINGMLNEHLEEICRDIKQQIEGNEDFKNFPISIGLKLAPAGKLIRVKTKISWGTKRKDEAESDVDALTPELPGMGGKQ